MRIGDEAVLPVICTLAVRVPVAVGENCMKKVQVLKPAPCAANCEQGSEMTKSPGFWPVRVVDVTTKV